MCTITKYSNTPLPCKQGGRTYPSKLPSLIRSASAPLVALRPELLHGGEEEKKAGPLGPPCPNNGPYGSEDKGPRSAQPSGAIDRTGTGLGVTPGAGLPGVGGAIATAPGGQEGGGKGGGAAGQSFDAKVRIETRPVAAASPGAGSGADALESIRPGLVSGGTGGESVAKGASTFSAGSSSGGGARSAAASWARRDEGPMGPDVRMGPQRTKDDDEIMTANLSGSKRAASADGAKTGEKDTTKSSIEKGGAIAKF